MINLFRGDRSGTIRAKVLAIAIIPSIALLIVGAGISAFLVNQGLQARQFAEDVRSSLGPMTRFIVATQEERRLSTLHVTGLSAGGDALTFQRQQVDRSLAEVATTAGELADQADALSVQLGKLNTSARQLPAIRERIDTEPVAAAEVYEYYSGLVELVGEGIRGIARSGTGAEPAVEQMIGYDLFRSVEAQARSHVLVERAIAEGLNMKVYHELAHQMGTYHEIVERVQTQLRPAEQRAYQAIKDAPFWKTLTEGDNAVMALGPGHHHAKFSLQEWEAAAGELSNGLLKLYQSHSSFAADVGAASGNSTLITSLILGAVVLLVALVAIAVALRLSRRLIGRLTRLREETLALSESELPDVVQRLRQGDRVDVEEQVPWLDHGDDEIGQVANAFNKAQRTAIAAAVQEAETRKGVGAVFLNIAHRTQIIVHRQLKVLDKVERSEDDPDQLRLLFQLDHLATRSRRNAENLIILGGQQPGRQWRNPVSLREIARSAIAETEHYTRVVAAEMPDTLMDGSVIADLAHLLAELVDNATAFSPPQARVEVRGNLAGRGVIVEIEDQGLGMEPEQREKLNQMLRKPPDFSVMALSAESRVGMFVVAKLAQRNGIKIALRESIYGGTTAVVLIPSLLIVQESTPHEVPAMTAIGTGPLDTAALHRLERALPPAEPEPAAEDGLDVTSSASEVLDVPSSTSAPRPSEPPPPATPPLAGGPPLIGAGWKTVVFDQPPVPKPAAAQDRPPLPRRTRQHSIAPQLKDDPGLGALAEQPEQPEQSEGDAERTRSQLAAFQQGGVRGRDADPADTALNGHRA